MQSTTQSMFVSELLDVLRLSNGSASSPFSDKTFRLKHPFSWQPVSGLQVIQTLTQHIQSPVQNIELTQQFNNSENVVACCWRVTLEGSQIQGTTAVVADENSVEIRILLNSFPATRQWRESVMALSGGLMPSEGWEFPQGTDLSTPEYDPAEKLDPKLPPGIVLADDVIFEAPIVLKGLQGIELVTRAIGHASAVYGPRDYKHKIKEGHCLLSLWNVAVSGIPIEAANLIQMNQQGKVAKMTVSFQPWPAIKLFHDRMRVRTKAFLSPDYFEASH